MTIIGKTYFTYLKSRKNKISSRNCNMSCKTGSMQNSKPTTCTRLSGKRFQTKTRRSQGCTVSLIAYWSKPCFTQENKVNIRLHYIVTYVKCLVSNWLSIEKHKIYSWSWQICNTNKSLWLTSHCFTCMTSNRPTGHGSIVKYFTQIAEEFSRKSVLELLFI